MQVVAGVGQDTGLAKAGPTEDYKSLDLLEVVIFLPKKNKMVSLLQISYSGPKPNRNVKMNTACPYNTTQKVEIQKTNMAIKVCINIAFSSTTTIASTPLIFSLYHVLYISHFKITHAALFLSAHSNHIFH